MEDALWLIGTSLALLVVVGTAFFAAYVCFGIGELKERIRHTDILDRSVRQDKEIGDQIAELGEGDDDEDTDRLRIVVRPDPNDPPPSAS